MKKDLIDFALQLGFDDVKMTNIQSIYEHYAKLEKWIEKGYNAKMNFFLHNQEKRKQPNLMLENAKSIIVFAKKYYPNIKYLNNIKIAKYALNEDYHTIIKNLLKQYSTFLRENFKANTLISVDSGAIMEKTWATVAGLGWLGKNGLVLNENLGSFFNIGILLTDLEIEPDIQIENKCKNCKKCIESCPTSAIVAPHIIDTNQCIAYHTIENKEKIPDSIMLKIKQTGYIFGCDICQDVCPFNQKVISKEKEKCFNIFDIINTDDINNFTVENFNQIFVSSAIKRTKYNRFIKLLNLFVKDNFQEKIYTVNN